MRRNRLESNRPLQRVRSANAASFGLHERLHSAIGGAVAAAATVLASASANAAARETCASCCARYCAQLRQRPGDGQRC